MRENLKSVLACSIIVLSVSILTLLAVFGTPFFQDYPAFLDGGYRISLGQVPFHDFIMPPIPVGFYMQAFFNLIFGANVFSMAMLSIFLSSILAVLFYFVSRKYFGVIFSTFMAIAFAYSYSGIIGFSWYNQTAFFFFMLNMLVLIKTLDAKTISNETLLISSALTILSIFSKTDIGAIHFVSLLIYFIYAYKGDIKRILGYYAVPVISVTIAFNLLIKLIGNPAFRNGVYIERILIIFERGIIEKIIYSFSFYIMVILLIIYFKDIKKGIKNNLLVLILMLNLFILGASLTSGQSIQTKIMALPLNLLLIYLLISKKLKENREKKDYESIVKIFAMSIIFLLIFTQFNDLSNRRERYEFTAPTRQIYNIFFASPEVSGFTKIDFGCYKGIPLRNDYYTELEKIRKIIEENGNDFILMGNDYLFLYCDYGIKPPKNLPAWFFEGNTFGKNEAKNIINYFNKERPRVVIEQMIASKETKTQLANKLISLGYYDNYSATAPSPTGLMKIFVLKSS